MAIAMERGDGPSLDPKAKEAAKKELNFWRWLLANDSSSGGLSRWCNWILGVHGLIGMGFSHLVRRDLPDIAQLVMLPLAGVLVGLTFAWAATAISIVSAREFRLVMQNSKHGVRGTANYFQLAILVMLSATIFWAIAGMGPFDAPPFLTAEDADLWARAALFAFTSFAITECYSAVNLSRLALLVYSAAKQAENDAPPKEP